MYARTVTEPLDDPRVVARATALLDAFDLRRPTLGLSELARRSGVPKATTHRLAAQLVEFGLLERSNTGYCLGLRLFEMGQRVPRARSLRDAALPFLEDLFVASRETVHLATSDGNEVLYIERIVGHDSDRTPSRIAGRLPLHSTATGKAILAHLGDDRIEVLLSRPLRAVTARTIVVPAVLRDELDLVRRTGWAVEREETAVGYVSVAAAVFDVHSQPVAALSVTGPMLRLDPNRLGPAVHTAARALTRTMGGADIPPATARSVGA